jgi:glycosyltransferase involved in cell wall biosynthesis
MRVVVIPDLEVEGWRSMALYAQQLARWLPHLAPEWTFHVVHGSIPRWGRARFVRFATRYIGFPQHVARVCRKQRADVHHVLDHSYAHLLRWLDPRRTVVTVHDLYPCHLLNAGERGARSRMRDLVLRWVMTALREAVHVIADSEFTKSELRRWLDYPEARITVVPLGGDHVDIPVAGGEAERLFLRLDLPRHAPFLLHVGSCDERKNIPTLLRAFSRLRALVGEELYLLQVGGRFTPLHQEMIRRLGIARYVRRCADLSWEHMAVVYRSAALLLFPSTYEGFGLPVLEAMRMGTPVVALAAGAVPEVLGDAGVLVRENDAEAFAEAAARVLADERMRSELVERARRRAHAFTWRETAQKVLAVYRSVAASDFG